MLCRLPLLTLALLASACGPRVTARPVPVGGVATLSPLPPPPPGSIVVFGPARIEAVDVVASDVGWDRDLVHATRVVSYDVVVSQARATCSDKGPPPRLTDDVGCSGVATIPAACTVEAPVRGRIEVSVTYAIDVAQRCAGESTPFVVPATGDARPALSNLGSACFRAHNKFHPESAWTSLYALTELQIGEHADAIEAPYPRLLAGLLAGDARPAFCRDDGSYLEGSPGAPGAMQPSADLDDATMATLASSLATRAQLGADPAVPLTAGAWRTEQELWEQCNAPAARGAVAVQERCQLLRQLDRFVRDVDDLARPETPKGAATTTGTSASPATSASKP